MKRIDGRDPNFRRRVDMSDMPISNMKCKCEECNVSDEFKNMCQLHVNTLKCLTTQKRFLRSIHQTEDRDDDIPDEDMKEEQNKSVRAFLDSIAVSEKDDIDEDVKPTPPKKETKVDEEDNEDEDDDD